MKYPIALFLAFVLIACGTTPMTLTDYPEVASFTAEEQQDLRKIVAFMDQSVCQAQTSNTDEVEPCYRAFFLQLASAAQAGEVFIPFSSAERAALFGQLQPQTVQSIWAETQAPDRAASILAIKPTGKYADFVAAYGESNSTAKTYHELLNSRGFVSTGPFIDHLSSANQQEVPLHDERMRLLIAVQFLAMSTQ